MNRFFFAALFALSGCAAPPPSNAPVTASVSAAQSATKPGAPKSPKTMAISQSPSDAAPDNAPLDNAPRQLTWSVAGALPHDTSAFTEGLLWRDGFFYESTGLEGQSDVRRVDPASGQVLSRWKLPPQLFGEGLAWLDGRFYDLTWQTKVGFKLDEKLKQLSRFSFQNEGWGLTTDGEKLLQSDGTDILTWRDSQFATLGLIRVTRGSEPLRNLNELEWIKGYVWANVWQTDEIVVIDPKNGHVVAQLDLSGILAPQDRTGQEDVLNGIAYDAATGRIFVTGKKWPRVFWIRVENMPTR